MPTNEPPVPSPSWRVALAPGESHPFGKSPGWWDLRDLGDDADDVPAARTALLRALPPIPANGNVLDIGAGTGTLVALLAHSYPHVHYTLLDANPAALQRASEKLHRCRLTTIVEAVAPMATEPLPGGPFDLVISSIALHDIAVPTAPDDLPGRARHAGEHRSLLRRILASLVPGGHLIYADAMRPRFRVVEHIDQLVAAGFVEVDCAYVRGRMLVAGGQRSIAPVAAVNQGPAP
ncbi:MAG: class I SAM-dependent methyltransferase [Chloroflexota bacterium]|nr:class I SAM-dependent methyltransferase [Chloroflexia bacterium]MDQ3467100.1 class I SAM-dependent methyltransferase [Chloroflexota bacterium]